MSKQLPTDSSAVEPGQVYDGGYCTWTVLTETIAGWWCLYEPKESDHKGDVILPAAVLKKYGVLS